MLPRVAALAPSASFVKAAGIESPSTTLWAPGGASNPTVVQTVQVCSSACVPASVEHWRGTHVVLTTALWLQTMLKDIREGGEAAARR